ncbi:Ssb Single-stranded DNA-binding protein [uncultured Caudovirales phage]|uniref:Ssb Single-stranded DNA-binding protein n=1 Tax=uncultured Caudovirales phage TaxID=2100421 RepID=A0A6J5L9W4_9CAUD|nr:Ssb Single-stranded DNA-binding protein [uncultured Caudovirales phage]
MSRSLNEVTLFGTLGKDAEIKNTQGGVSVATLSLATERNWKDKASGEWKKETDWHRVTAWRVENLADYLTKGKQILVRGRLQTRSYEDKNGEKRFVTEVIADNIILAGGGDKGGGSPRDSGRDSGPPMTDDDIPF